MKYDQDLWYDLKKLLWQDELNPRVRCAFGNVSFPERDQACQEIKRVQMDFHFDHGDVNHSEVPYEISTFPERDQA